MNVTKKEGTKSHVVRFPTRRTILASDRLVPLPSASVRTGVVGEVRLGQAYSTSNAMMLHLVALIGGILLIAGGITWSYLGTTRYPALGWALIVIGGVLAAWGFFDG